MLRMLTNAHMDVKLDSWWTPKRTQTLSLPMGKTLVRSGDISSIMTRPTVCPWATSFCPFSSPPSAEPLSLAGLQTVQLKQDVLNLVGDCGVGPPSCCTRACSKKQITENRYGHTFGCIYSTAALGFAGFSMTEWAMLSPHYCPTASSGEFRRWVGRGKAEGEGLKDFIRPGEYKWRNVQNIKIITWSKLQLRLKHIFYIIMNYTEMKTVSFMGSVSKDGGGLWVGRGFKQPFCK